MRKQKPAWDKARGFEEEMDLGFYPKTQKILKTKLRRPKAITLPIITTPKPESNKSSMIFPPNVVVMGR
jgi:hypothetical protein